MGKQTGIAGTLLLGVGLLTVTFVGCFSASEDHDAGGVADGRRQDVAVPDAGRDGALDRALDGVTETATDAREAAAPDLPKPDVVKNCTTADSLGVSWCAIPSGCFKMGSPSTEAC